MAELPSRHKTLGELLTSVNLPDVPGMSRRPNVKNSANATTIYTCTFISLKTIIWKAMRSNNTMPSNAS